MKARRTTGTHCPVCGRDVRVHQPSGLIWKHHNLEDQHCPGSSRTEQEAREFASRYLADIEPDPPTYNPWLDTVVSSSQAIQGENVVSIEALRQDIKQATGETFPVGSVIRWERWSIQTNKTYTYAALKLSTGNWIVTGNSGWGLAGETVTYARLIEQLGSNDVSNVALATEWTSL